MATLTSISLKDDFTKAPGGRFRSHGPHSGQAFRDDILKPALRASEVVEVNLDGAYGLPSSFLDEAIGYLHKEVETGRLRIVLTDNDVALKLLNQSLAEHGKS